MKSLFSGPVRGFGSQDWRGLRPVALQPRNSAPTLGNCTWKDLPIQLKMEMVIVIGVISVLLLNLRFLF